MNIKLGISPSSAIAFQTIMSFKHFINDPEKLVNDALEALTYANPTLQYLHAEKGA